MNQISAKKKVQVDLKIATYRKIDSEREKVCEGCGRTNRPLSHSHLIPESYDSLHSSNPENIRLHCLDWEDGKGCHSKWEDGERGVVTEMEDFDENMRIIKRLNVSFYNKMISNLNG